MFQGLRQGSPLYILHKNEPRLEIGEVVSRTEPSPMFNPSTPMYPYAPITTMDVVARVNGEDTRFEGIRADLSIADTKGGTVVVSDSRESISGEIENLRANSARVLESVDFHRKVVESCGQMLATLNPQLQKEAQQAAEIEMLKGELADIKAILVKSLKGGKTKED